MKKKTLISNTSTISVKLPESMMLRSVLGDALRPGSILDSHDELQVEEMLNVSRLTKKAHEQDIQVMVEGPGHVPLNEVAGNDDSRNRS